MFLHLVTTTYVVESGPNFYVLANGPIHFDISKWMWKSNTHQ